jgi:hypothetical protein
MITSLMSELLKKRPDILIGTSHRPRMRRWFLNLPNPHGWTLSLNQHMYLEDRERPEHDHDHIGDNWTQVLVGGINEETSAGLKELREGDRVERLACDRHRLWVPRRYNYCVTIFALGPTVNPGWGYHTERGKLTEEQYRSYMKERADAS